MDSPRPAPRRIEVVAESARRSVVDSRRNGSNSPGTSYGTTIVVITHEQVVAAHLPRQVSMLDGRVVSDRTGVVA